MSDQVSGATCQVSGLPDELPLLRARETELELALENKKRVLALAANDVVRLTGHLSVVKKAIAEHTLVRINKDSHE